MRITQRIVIIYGQDCAQEPQAIIFCLRVTRKTYSFKVGSLWATCDSSKNTALMEYIMSGYFQ